MWCASFCDASPLEDTTPLLRMHFRKINFFTSVHARLYVHIQAISLHDYNRIGMKLHDLMWMHRMSVDHVRELSLWNYFTDFNVFAWISDSLTKWTLSSHFGNCWIHWNHILPELANARTDSVRSVFAFIIKVFVKCIRIHTKHVVRARWRSGWFAIAHDQHL